MCLAIPAQVSELLDDNQQFATVDIMGVRRRANIELLRDDLPHIGDWVLLHVGFAMCKISAEYAERQLELLGMLGESGEMTNVAERDDNGANHTGTEPADEIR